LTSDRCPESIRLPSEVGQPAIDAYDAVITELGGLDVDENLREEEKRRQERRRAKELASSDW